jgi:hypothetical protein
MSSTANIRASARSMRVRFSASNITEGAAALGRGKIDEEFTRF